MKVLKTQLKKPCSSVAVFSWAKLLVFMEGGLFEKVEYLD